MTEPTEPLGPNAQHGKLSNPAGWTVAVRYIAIGLAVLLVSGVSVAAIAAWRIGATLQSNAVDIGDPTDEPIPEVGAIEGGFNILILGSDTRAGQGGIGGTEDDVQGERNDVTMLLHVSQDQTNAVAVSFPRDLVVDIPACEATDGSGPKYPSTEPINTALNYGGLACAVSTVEQLTGLQIQFAGTISFTGVIAMADAIGGVPVCVGGPVIDDGITLPAAGTYTLSGMEALGFLRSRSSVGDGSDLTRISAQQVYLSSLVRTLKSSGTLSDVPSLYRLANVAADNLVLSTSLADVSTMVSIARALNNIPIEAITFVQYPGTTGGEGLYEGKVQPLTEPADQLFAAIASDSRFTLEQQGDGEGSTADPAAPAPEPVDPAIPVIPGVSGQGASVQTCTITNDY